VLTIVLPLLVAGSVVLALLSHLGTDRFVNAALSPLTATWLGLPVALGVPLLFGVLRKELSLLMLFQALGTQDVGAVLDPTQIMTLLLFVTFYVPCLSTLAVMVTRLGVRDALRSAGLSLATALVVAGAGRIAMSAFA
jgi:ferrous iron transport protein B